MMTNKQLLAVAKKQLGKGGATFRKYVGIGSGEPWCDAFAFWLFNANGCGSLLKWTGKQKYFCPESIKWCKKNLAQIPPYLAMECDIVYYDWDKNGKPNHVGIVEKRWDNTKIYAIEGNTDGGKVAQKKRKKYIQAVYRPHFTPSKLKKSKLTVDGVCGYNTIAGIQKWLSIKEDGILGQATVKAIQKKCKVSSDGAWGTKTSRALQKIIGAKQDGDFGPASVKKLQEYINKACYEKKKATPAPTPAPSTSVNPKAQKAVTWAKAIAKSKKYTYKKWNNKKKNTKLCPICHPGSGNGWNCIGFCSAAYYHGAGAKEVTCSCSGLGTDGFFTKVTLASWKKRNGPHWIMIDNGGKKGGADISASKLLPGDLLICYDSKGKFHHIVLWTGNGKYIDDTNTSKNHIAERSYSVIQKKYHCTRAFRYTG